MNSFAARSVMCLSAGLLLHTASPSLRAQTPLPAGEARLERPLGIYIDCGFIVCDLDYLRTEIDFVTHLRDRHDADVHILVTGQPTAQAGDETTLSFIGQKDFAGVDDTLRYVSPPAEPQHAVRQRLAGAIKRGLVRYVNRTALGEDIDVAYVPSKIYTPAATDPWDYWTFDTTVRALLTGEEAIKTASANVSASANRTTDEWKTTALLTSQYSSSSFELGAGQSIESTQRSYAFTSVVVNSVGEQAGWGARASAGSSTFLNQSRTLRLAPAVEYNLFPYAESNYRMLTVEYSVGINDFDYIEETIFGETAETLFDHRILASLRFTQPWGSAELAVEGSQYLHDLGKNRVIVVGSVDWNLVRGLSLVASVSYHRIRDQLFLPGRGASEEEILLRRRQLATSYSYTALIGVSYKFGSRYAHVVNRRFEGSVGGVMLDQ